MDKSQSLTEENGRQKFFHKHPTIIDTQPKFNHIIRRARKSMPKIKLTTNDKSSDFRSVSSPRLKNFPAEERRRVVRTPRPNVFPFPDVIPTPAKFGNNPNSCQGDSIPQSLLPQPIFHNYNQTTSQPFLSHPISNQTHHSEIIVNPNSILQSPDRPLHRPFVSNAFRNSSKRPHINPENRTNESPTNDSYIEDAQPSKETNIPLQNESHYPKKIVDLSECEKQPVGGRNAELHRLAHLSTKKKSTETNSPMPEAPILNQSYQNAEFYPQYRQQMQPSGFYYDFYHNPQPNVGRIPTAGMTSPQDFNVNRMRSYGNYYDHHPNYQQPSAQAIVRPPGLIWPQTILPKNSGLQQSCQHARNIPRDTSYPSSPSSTQQQQQSQEYPPQLTENNNRKIIKKKIQFTPAMIHDQELLITTMKRQEIPEEIMKRQFEALLNEQRRQLLYEQQLEQSQEDEEGIHNVDISRRRKVSNIDGDGKPEWMMNITPTWIPYPLIGNMENNTSHEGKKCVKINENLNQHQEHEHCQQYYGYPTNQQYEIPYQNVYQQYQRPIDNREHQYEIFYHQPNYNRSQNATQHTTNTYPTSILKTRNDNSSMMKQQHQMNNGLQDSETVKRAMEDLKNAKNRKGFEYLMNLNKKEQHVQLNGIQDPDDPLVHNLSFQSMPEDVKQDVKRGPSANGLENSRNPNNPSPPPTLHFKNVSEPVLEYPRQRTHINIDNCHVMPAEKENDTMANSMVNGYQNNSSAFQNSTVVGNARYKNSIQAQVCCQDKEGIAGHYNHGIPNNLVRSNSLPPNMYSEYRPARVNNFYGVPDNIYNEQMVAMKPNEDNNEQYVQPNMQIQANIHIPEQYLEARIIGGFKYLARAEYKPYPEVYETPIGDNISNQPIAFY